MEKDKVRNKIGKCFSYLAQQKEVLSTEESREASDLITANLFPELQDKDIVIGKGSKQQMKGGNGRFMDDFVKKKTVTKEDFKKASLMKKLEEAQNERFRFVVLHKGGNYYVANQEQALTKIKKCFEELRSNINK